MKPVRTRESPDFGRWACYHACVASICEVSISEVPIPQYGWDLDLWLAREFDLTFVESDGPLAGWAIAGGQVRRLDPWGLPTIRHAVVAYDGSVVHDPTGDVRMFPFDHWTGFRAKGFKSENHWLLQPPESYGLTR